MLMVWTVLFGCSQGFDPVPRIRYGEPDSGGVPVDSGAPVMDTGWPTPVDAAQVCYPGPDDDGTVCVPTVDRDPSWSPSYGYPDPYQGNPQYLAPARLIDLHTADPDLAVAANFILSEFMQERKGRYGLFQTHTVRTLQQIRAASGGPLRVTSGYRNVVYNDRVGGATWSRHMYGDAVDLQSDAVSLDDLAALCEDQGAAFVSVYTNHVHCDWRTTPLDPAFFDVTDASRASAQAALPRLDATLRATDGDLQVQTTGFDEGAPRIRWAAFDATGRSLDVVTAETYRPPDDAVHVLVEVGGQVVRTHTLP
ncbi:MAG: D-Ala-D-Ala carboxypeptidase family metallohydrolase [Myxococcota bacterium]